MDTRVLLLICLVGCVLGTVTVEAGFGCPKDQMACHEHCRSAGFMGGYCTNLFWLTCKCYNG